MWCQKRYASAHYVHHRTVVDTNDNIHVMHSIKHTIHYFLRKVFKSIPMPSALRNKIRSLYWARKLPRKTEVDLYQQRIDQEVNRFADDVNVHDLPEIFHYWSNKYLLPMFDALGIRGVNELFADTIALVIEGGGVSGADSQCHVVSMGSGNCDVEVEVAKLLSARGCDKYVIECIDIVPDMLERGRELVEDEGLADHFIFTCADIKSWQPEVSSVDVMIAHQSLHHFLELEILFDKIQAAIGEFGVFVASDMIGRNGHMRWPEAKAHIDSIWKGMPDRYKYNHMLQRTEKDFVNWDCSTVGFEGIRAQDILPLLLERFNFKLFLGYGNLTDIFIDRAFGHNFDVNNPDDIAFIDKVSLLDEELIEGGVIKPTHMIAIMSNNKEAVPGKYYKNLSPEFCLRPAE